MRTIRWNRGEIYQHPHSSICAILVQRELREIHHKGIVQVVTLSRTAFRMTVLGYLSRREMYPELEYELGSEGASDEAFSRRSDSQQAISGNQDHALHSIW